VVVAVVQVVDWAGRLGLAEGVVRVAGMLADAKLGVVK